MSNVSKDTNEYHRRDSIATSECTFSLSEESTYMERLLEKEKRELAEELMWLRESSKGALKKSWSEVEYLQRQCAEHVDVKKQLNVQLNDIRAEEEVWRLRCLAAEKIQAMQSEPNKSPKDMTRAPSCGNLQDINETGAFDNKKNIRQTYEKPLMTFRDKIRSWSSGNLLSMEEDTKSSLSCEPGKKQCSSLTFSPSMRLSSSQNPSGIDESCRKVLDVQMQSRLDRAVSMVNLYDNNTTNASEDYLVETFVETNDACGENTFYINGNSKSQEDLSLIISSRDQIISNLEQTINQQLNNMQNLQAEMQCLMEAQRIKEKRLCNSHKQKEDRLDKVIGSLRKKLKENEETEKEHDKSLLECKLYIRELAVELEEMLNIIKTAEEGGFIIDQNLSP